MPAQTSQAQLFEHIYGGNQDEFGLSMKQAGNGDYIITGFSRSWNNADPNLGGEDIFIMQTGADGSLNWNRVYGTTGNDRANHIEISSDGGYIVAGFVTPPSPCCTDNQDIYVLKTDENGTIQWDRTFGGLNNDWADCVHETENGDFIVVGTTESYGAGDDDVVIIRLDANGNLVWARSYGGNLADQGLFIRETSNNNIVVAGWTLSFGSTGPTDQEVYMFMTDAAGDIIWANAYGLDANDVALCVKEIENGNFILTGGTNSWGAGGRDALLMEVDVNGVLQWSSAYGGPATDESELGMHVVELGSGQGYAMCGITTSFGAGRSDYYLLRTDNQGNLQWSQTYGGGQWDEAREVLLDGSGGFSLIGGERSFQAGGLAFYNIMLVHTDHHGFTDCHDSLANTLEADSLMVTVEATTAVCRINILCPGPGIEADTAAADSVLCETCCGTNQLQYHSHYGMEDEEQTYGLELTDDGGNIMAGHVYSWTLGDAQAELVRTDANGAVLWSHQYGFGPEAPSNEYFRSVDVARRHGGGYIAAGYSDVNQITPNTDIYIQRAAEGGAHIWMRFFGGPTTDEKAYSVREADNGFIVAGYGQSLVSANRDMLVIYLAPDGTTLWQTSLGGAQNDEAHSVIQLNDDDDLIVVGATSSFGPNAPNASNFYVARLDGQSGACIWQRALGGNGNEVAYDVAHDAAGDLVIVGESDSWSWNSNPDWYIVKMDVNGNYINSRDIHGLNGDDRAFAVDPTCDGGFAIAGATTSLGPGLPNPNAVWIKFNAAFAYTDLRVYGGNATDVARDIRQRPDGGYNMAGYVYLEAGANPPPGQDYQHYLIATDCEGITTCKYTDKIWPGLLSHTTVVYNMDTIPCGGGPGSHSTDPLETDSLHVQMDICTATLIAPPDGPADERGARSLKHGAGNDAEQMELAPAVRLMPNPVNEGQVLKLRYVLQADSELDIRVGDLFGEEIVRERRTDVAGEHTMEISTRGWPSGSYMVRVRSGGTVTDNILIVVK